MDLLTTVDLQVLARDDQRGPAISLFIPTTRVTATPKADPIRWKNLLTAVAASLEDTGHDAKSVRDLLAPAWALHNDSVAWEHMSEGLAMFLRPGWHRLYRLPIEVPKVAGIGHRFVISPLLGAVSSDEHFLVLSVSQRNVRLLEATPNRAEVLELPDVPISLRGVVEETEPRSATMTRSLGGGRPGGAIFHGHGAADGRFKNDEVVKFFRQLNDGLRPYLTDQNLPVVLVGLARNVALFREVAKYGNILVDTVDADPDDLSPQDLHAAAWPIAATHFAGAKRTSIKRFEELHGTGRASNDPAVVLGAAEQGQVETLFVARAPACWVREHGGRPTVVRLGNDEAFTACERVDRSVLATLASGGAVHQVDEQSLLDGQLMAATLRY